MITGINESKTLTEHNMLNLMIENVIQIKSGIMIIDDASLKNIDVKKIIFGILSYVAAKMGNIYHVLLTIQ